MKVKYLIFVVVLFVMFSVILTSCQNQTTTTQMTEPTDDVDLVLKLTAKNFSFSEESITVKKGQTVRIELTITEGMHDWVLDEFSAATKQASSGDTVTVVFTADKSGEFEYYCSVGNHRAQGMIGTLIVEE